jgi:hypothetical protein
MTCHSVALYNTTQHSRALHCIALHCIALHGLLHSTALLYWEIWVMLHFLSLVHHVSHSFLLCYPRYSLCSQHFILTAYWQITTTNASSSSSTKLKMILPQPYCNPPTSLWLSPTPPQLSPHIRSGSASELRARRAGAAQGETGNVLV